MSNRPTRSGHFAHDGHPLNIKRDARYHTDRGGTICGECAVHEASPTGSWDARKSTAILAAAGIERDRYYPGEEEADWCIDCDKDFTS